MYLGLIIGFVNVSLLFPRFVGVDILGLTQWLTEYAGLFLLIGSFGTNTATIRFFPHFKDREQQHNGFLSFLFLLRTAGLFLTIILIILTKDQIIALFSDQKSAQYIRDYYFLLPVLLALTSYSELLENYAAALLRPRIATFFREVVIRLSTLIFILFYYFEWISLQEFIILFALRFLLAIGGLVFFIYWIGELHLKVDWSIFRKPIFKNVANYGLYSVFASLGSKITTKIDILMIAALTDLTATGIYTTMYFVSTVIVIPHLGISKIASPLISEGWKKNDLNEIGHLYQRTALNNFIVALLIFIGIYINLDHLVTILGSENFSGAEWVAIYLGLGQLVHVVNGYNGLIINYSPKYRFDLISKAITAVLAVITNYYFIQWYGIIGAAIATAITVILSNIINQLFVYLHYKIHPFSRGMLHIIGVGILAILLNHLLPSLNGIFLIDLIYRSVIITIFYTACLLIFKISPDISNLTLQLWQHFLGKHPSKKP